MTGGVGIQFVLSACAEKERRKLDRQMREGGNRIGEGKVSPWEIDGKTRQRKKAKKWEKT